VNGYSFFDSVFSSRVGFIISVISITLFFLILYWLLIWYLITIPERPVFSEYYISSGDKIPERLGGIWMISLPILDDNKNICFVDSAFNCVLIIDGESIFSNILILKQKDCVLRRKKSITLKASTGYSITINIEPHTFYIVDSANKVKDKKIRWGTADCIKNAKQDYFLGNEVKVDNVYKLAQLAIEMRDKANADERKKKQELYENREKQQELEKQN
jgi:hypothetical protein